MEISLTMVEVQGLQARISELNRMKFVESNLQRELQIYAAEIAKIHEISAPFELSSDLTKIIKKEELVEEKKDGQ